MSSLDTLIAPPATAIVTMECQRGIIGDLATIRSLRETVVETGAIDNMVRVVQAGRAAGVQVVHATARFRPDRVGSPTNAPLLQYAASIPDQLVEGTESCDVIAELGPEPVDVESARRHGVSPFTGTDLDSILRSCGVSTVVAVGVSLNVGIVGLCVEAVNLGYRAVVVADATVAVPPTYAEAVLANTIAQLATITDTAAIEAAWGATSSGGAR